MKRKFTWLVQSFAVIFSVINPLGMACAQTQLPPDAPLTDQLKALYKVTKFGLDGGGFTVLSPGTILVIQKGGIVGVPPANITMGIAVFKDGDLKQPSAGNRMFLGNVTRFLQVGEKVYVQKVDVNLKSDKVQLTIVECDQCNGVNQTSLFKGVVSFEFRAGFHDRQWKRQPAESGPERPGPAGSTTATTAAAATAPARRTRVNSNGHDRRSGRGRARVARQESIDRRQAHLRVQRSKSHLHQRQGHRRTIALHPFHLWHERLRLTTASTPTRDAHFLARRRSKPVNLSNTTGGNGVGSRPPPLRQPVASPKVTRSAA
jgi:hypothetical protein